MTGTNHADNGRWLRARATELMPRAAALRDAGHGAVVSYSRKVFIALTRLCRDSCHYCTFAQPPRPGARAYLTPEEVLEIARAGRDAGCHEALFTLGDKPELRYEVARHELAGLGHTSTIEYLAAMCDLVRRETGLLPHVNPGVLGREDVARLREASASQGLMLESTAQRLCERGGPHFGSPDKQPAARLATLRLAGELRVPFTTGILIGIGETRSERVDALLAIKQLHDEYGHIQEVIVQNFRAKHGTRMAHVPDAPHDELLWTIAVARLILGADMNIQAPPNLSGDDCGALIAAGINDWGGISPVTPDHVNPEAPWPALDKLRAITSAHGKVLVERLPSYPAYCRDARRWHAAAIATMIVRAVDSDGFARMDDWSPGLSTVPSLPRGATFVPVVSNELRDIVAKARAGAALTELDIARLFRSRDDEFHFICEQADELRHATSGDIVRYVVNRNINYTNICTYHCTFCAFSKGTHAQSLRGAPYDLPLDEISRRVAEAWARGATEVCMQGGIHPDYTGETYLDIVRAAKRAAPQIHVHAFTPLEVSHGAATLNLTVRDFLYELMDAGLGTLPGTAAEILDDEIRREICPDKVTTDEWLSRDGNRACDRVALDRDHHVRPCRRTETLGAPPAAHPCAATTHGRFYRIRAASVRAHGGAGLSEGPCAQRADLSRGRADARGGAARVASGDCEHPGVVGEDGHGGYRRVSRRRRQRSWGHADERKHFARRRHAARPGNGAATHGRIDPLGWPAAGAAQYALRRAAGVTH